MNCNEYIRIIYESPKVNEFISRIEPADLQDDLKQEMAIVLLNYDCLKIAQMHHRGELISFAMGILWKMGRLQKGEFYKTYKANNREKAENYLRAMTKDNNAMQMSRLASKLLKDKLLIDANEAHESIIFQAYVEMGTCKKVAEHFGIPKHHVDKIVLKCKNELKSHIKKNI